MKKGFFATSDIESNNWIDFLMIGFFDGKEYKVFFSIDEYIKYVTKKEYSGLRIYFHNGGRFDFLFLIDKLMEIGEVKFKSRGTGLIGLEVLHKNGRLEFYDSYALLPASLEKLIKTYEIEYKKIPIDFTKKLKKTDKQLLLHLENDCKSLFYILQKFENDEGYLSNTIASHAMHKFRENFFDGDFWNVSEHYDTYFREKYYKGGRVEVYKGFGKNLYYYDVNSLYPFAMLEKMPCGAPIHTTKFQKNKIGFYEIELMEDYNPLISIICIKNKLGNFYIKSKKGDRFNLCSVEILELEKEVKLRIVEGYYFMEAGALFNNYVNYYFEIKKTAKTDAERYISKLMLNSLYGKFGQKLSGQNIEVDNGQGDYTVYDAELGLLLVDKKLHIKYKGVYVAAYITAVARMKHYTLMKEVGFEHVYYCDTDSLITDKKIKTSDKIGELKLETEIKEGVFLMPKVYGYKDFENNEYVRIKGFSTKGDKNFSYENLKKLASGEVSELVQVSDRILGFREAIKRKNDIKKDNGKFLKLAEQSKKLSLNYTRRKIIKDKKFIFVTECLENNEVANIKKKL
jgi:hypothetical protein